MGTHPISESDFDCLTEMFSRFAARATRTFVRPPVQVYGLSGSYASATYSAAVKSDAQADVAADMVTLAKVFENEKIADFFLILSSQLPTKWMPSRLLVDFPISLSISSLLCQKITDSLLLPMLLKFMQEL